MPSQPYEEAFNRIDECACQYNVPNPSLPSTYHKPILCYSCTQSCTKIPMYSCTHAPS